MRLILLLLSLLGAAALARAQDTVYYRDSTYSNLVLNHCNATSPTYVVLERVDITYSLTLCAKNIAIYDLSLGFAPVLNITSLGTVNMTVKVFGGAYNVTSIDGFVNVRGEICQANVVDCSQNRGNCTASDGSRMQAVLSVASQYKSIVRLGRNAPTPATPAPVAVPAPIPVPAPVPVPIPAPVPVPVSTPVPVPIPAPVPVPVSAPVPVPIPAPAPAPVAAPVAAPSVEEIYGVEPVIGTGTGPTLYVSTIGSDSAAGTLQAPLRTLAEAVMRVQPGGTIVLRAGTYQGAVVNQGYGTASAWVTLTAAPGEQVLLQGNPRGSQFATLYFYHSSCDEYAPAGSVCASSYWLVEGLSVRGDVAGGGDSNAVKIDTQHVQVSRCVLCCAVPDVVKIVRTANDAVVRRCEVYADSAVVQWGANSQGVDITGADRVRVVANYLHDLPDIAVYAKGNARNATFAANRIERTGAGHGSEAYNAIMLGQQTDESRLVDGPYESYDGLVVNNVVREVTGACLGASSSLNPRFYHNSCHRTALWAHAAVLVSTEGGLSYTPNKGAQFVNNILSQEAAHPRILRSTDREYTQPTEAPLDFKKNIYWASGAVTKYIWIPSFYQDRNFSDWQTAYQSIYGQSDTSTVVDPQFADVQLLTLSATSPAIASALPGFAQYDFNGRPRPSTPSVGALEP